jgi:hypothetical protein
MKKSKSLLILCALGLMLLGCYPQGPEYVEDLDLVYTNHNANYDFASKGTYARPDDIIKITGENIIGEPETIPDFAATAILEQFDDNMEALGWTKVDLNDDPDIAVLPASIEATTITYWYDYWYSWWDGYYPTYPGGGYYPGYPSYPVVTSYSTGTLLFLITDGDPDEVGGNGSHLVHWTFAANGVLTGNYDVNRVTKAIDQGFKQSPYLKTN